MDKGMIERSTRPTKDPGRLRFVYRLSGDIGGLALSALLDPYKRLVVISFDRSGVYAGTRRAVTARS